MPSPSVQARGARFFSAAMASSLRPPSALRIHVVAPGPSPASRAAAAAASSAAGASAAIFELKTAAARCQARGPTSDGRQRRPHCSKSDLYQWWPVPSRPATKSTRCRSLNDVLRTRNWDADASHARARRPRIVPILGCPSY